MEDADPAPDPALFVSDLQDANKKYFFYAYCLLKEHLYHSIKSHETDFSSFFCLLIEEAGSRAGSIQII